ncbi:MAG: protein-glutamate O-methyltransferase CheR [Rhodothermaceae bacterium]
MLTEEIEQLEYDLLLDTLSKRYGYDFSNYAKSSLKRQIKLFLEETGIPKISAIIPEIVYDESFAKLLVQNFSIPVTEMFRDPEIYLIFRNHIIPRLKKLPFIKIWHAGCATGEEVYSLAIILQEEGIYDKCQIYATDVNEEVLNKANEGIYEISTIKRSTANYNNSGGKYSFSKYYHSSYNSAIIDSSLKKNLTFARHNLVTDATFGEMNLILCRNVMIYFDKLLQDRVYGLFDDSLAYGGFLCLGSKENIQFSPLVDNYDEVIINSRIYEKILK